MDSERVVSRDCCERPIFLQAGGGVVSTTCDYLRFAQMLLNRGQVPHDAHYSFSVHHRDGVLTYRGQLDGVRVLSRKTVEFMTSNQVRQQDLIVPI